MKRLKNNVKGVTMVALVVTIIILLILASVAIMLTVGKNGIFSRAKLAGDEHIKQEATEAMNLKISGIQIECYTEKQTLPDLQYLADRLCEDTEMEYVHKEKTELASLDKIDVKDVNSIFTKIKKYPYEFEIDSELKLASIDGVKLAEDNTEKPSGTIEITKNGEYDVGSYEKANVNVPTYKDGSVLKINSKEDKIDVSNYQYADTSSLYTKSQYDDNYTLGFNSGETSAWKHITENVSGSQVRGHEFDFGFVPRFLFIKIYESNGYVFTYSSLDGCKTLMEMGDQNYSFKEHDVSAYMERTASGIRLINWYNEVDYLFDVWAIK